MLEEVKSTNPKGLDTWSVYGEILTSRLFIGSAQYPSPEVLRQAVKSSGAEVITVSLRRQSPDRGGGNQFWQFIGQLGIRVLPNTAGCHSVKEAVAIAEMSRELFSTDWIKLEIIGDDYNLQPDPLNLVRATETLIAKGFKVFPYSTDDLVLCRTLSELGCEVVMPWGSPIGTGQGLINPYSLKVIRERLPDIRLIVDAGIGKPSHACQAMEIGYDGVLLNTAIAKAMDPVTMARAFSYSIKAGRAGYLAGAMPVQRTASASTPTAGIPFWHQTTD